MDETGSKKTTAAYIEDFRALRAFLRLEANRPVEAVGWYEAMFSIIRSTISLFMEKGKVLKTRTFYPIESVSVNAFLTLS